MRQIGAGILLGLSIVVGYIVVSSLWTDPYSPNGQVQTPYSTSVVNGDIQLQTHFTPQLEANWLGRLLSYARTGVRIPWYSLVTREVPFSGTETEIITQIHQQRFDLSKPYVITGSHYSDLYMRNLGIFFNALLDPRLSADQTDWENRQRMALQTVAYDLAFLKQNGAAVTTIAPTGPQSVAGLNIYSPPSDALFSVLFTLKAMQDPVFLERLFPTHAPQPNLRLQTQSASAALLDQHRSTLSTALNHYLESTLDPETSLVRSDIALSSARDGVSRQSSFYDNVIAWSTVKLADELGIPHQATPPTQKWKQNIISTFWNPTTNIFHNDLSGGEMVFSADSLIVTSSGFFDLSNVDDRQKLNNIVLYIQTEKLDQPFPLRYSRSNTTNKMHLPVQLFAPSYMGDGIWSHWGIEYIKALLLLRAEHPEYGELAQKHLESYRQNIEKYGGYPELYAADGTLFDSGLVKGVLHTGWVVNYEQAKLMAR